MDEELKKLNEHIKEKLANLSEIAELLKKDYHKTAKAIKEESAKLKHNYKWFLENIHNCEESKDKQLSVMRLDNGKRICGYCRKEITDSDLKGLTSEDIQKIKMDQLKLAMVENYNPEK